jgi:hypothetical protein
LQEEFFQETVRKVQALYQFDCLRANKSTMAWGVEARVPFLDRQFLNVAMAIDPSEKMINKAEGKSAVAVYFANASRVLVLCGAPSLVPGVQHATAMACDAWFCSITCAVGLAVLFDMLILPHQRKRAVLCSTCCRSHGGVHPAQGL